MANFQTNFSRLKKDGAIPDIDESVLSPSVRQVIDNLTDDEVNVLIKISKGANAHLALHNKDHRFIVAGL